MTATEASASTRTRAAIRAQAQIIDHVTVSDRLIRDVLLGWPARADSVRVVLDAARTCGVDVATVPARSPAEVAEWLPKRRGASAKTCAACAAKDAELAAASAKLHAVGAALMAKDAELSETERQLEQARAHLLSEMRDWKRQWSEVCTERDAARARVAELEAEVARLRASSVPVPPVPLASEASAAPAMAPTAKPTLPPRPEPPARLQARQPARCHVSLEHDGVDLLAG
jgi:hypothetical protein